MIPNGAPRTRRTSSSDKATRQTSKLSRQMSRKLSHTMSKPGLDQQLSKTDEKVEEVKFIDILL